MTELRTERLRLRVFRPGDAHDFVALAGDLAVARMTSDIPHPLSVTAAGPWLRREAGEARFAAELDGRLVGGVGYFQRGPGTAELGFWIGRPYWGRGLATEAARRVVHHGFTHDAIDAFSSSHFLDNPSSGRVLRKLGFQPAGHSSMWCVARMATVRTAEFWLPRPASHREAGKDGAGRGWRTLFDRVLGSPRARAGRESG